MNLIRLANLYLRPIPEGFTTLAMNFGDITVRIIAVVQLPDALRLLVAAEQKLKSQVSIGTRGNLEIPTDPRKMAERAIEHFSHIMAVRDGSSWELTSPFICIAFAPETEEENKSLSSVIEVESATPALGGVKPRIDLPPEKLSSVFQDRFDGVALLSEALSHLHASAQFHEYVRVFERAFALSSTKLVAPLAEFLAGADQGYTEHEVHNWLVDIRHPATHADLREDFLLDADVRPVIFRVKQAAYDVLMNKSDWRVASTRRREIWRQGAWTMAPDSNTLVTEEGNTFQAELAALDEYGTFPLDFQAEIRSLLPSSWWIEPPNAHQDQKAGT